MSLRQSRRTDPARRVACHSFFVFDSDRTSYSARVTVLEGIQKSAEFLARKGVDSSRLNSELLLAHVLKLPRMKLYLNFERGLTQAEVDGLRELVRRRGQREPLQHIIGSTSFCGLELLVDRHVLVPRVETELLAEAGWTFLSQLNGDSRTALDFGTGSGCIAIALAVKCPTAKVYAVDISAEALVVARQNAARNEVADRIQFLHGNGFAPLADTPAASAGAFDLIISNPPYIPSGELETLPPEVRNFDPHGALDGGTDGLQFYQLLAGSAGAHLRPGGRIMVEFGDGQAALVSKLFMDQNWIVEEIRQDYTQRPRILIAKF